MHVVLKEFGVFLHLQYDHRAYVLYSLTIYYYNCYFRAEGDCVKKHLGEKVNGP